jgi:hypothetical protein
MKVAIWAIVILLSVIAFRMVTTPTPTPVLPDVCYETAKSGYNEDGKWVTTYPTYHAFCYNR